jgi:Protein of unknown function (DUF742)
MKRGEPGAGGSDQHDWLDSDAGPVVRPYAVTGGRGRPSVGGFDLLAFVVTAVDDVDELYLQPEHRAILARAAEPISVAELASYLDLALGVVRVLLGDLLQQGFIRMHDHGIGAKRPDDHVLKAVLHGLRAL